MRYSLTIIFILFFYCQTVAQSFIIMDSTIFKYGKQKIKLLKNDTNDSLIIFKTNLAVNTDGVPYSYHPTDLRGQRIAINSITNGVAIYRLSDSINLCVPNKSKSSKVPKGGFSKNQRNEFAAEAYKVFEEWRDAGYPKQYPIGYMISWRSVLIEKNGKPCIFSTGSKYAGYFASATSLKNGLTTNKGECDCNNQVDPYEVAALVLAANEKKDNRMIYKNPVRLYGASIGDLLVAYNLSNDSLVYAIVGDDGPANNLGEGSVILNMRLKGVTKFPKTKSGTYNLATDKNIIICIIPKSKNFEIIKPYKQTDIDNRVTNCFKQKGILGRQSIIDFLKVNSSF